MPRPRKPTNPAALPVASQATPHAYGPVELTAVRDLFWHNIAREMLNSLAVLGQEHPEICDGRFSILTRAGERIPIGTVTPLFAVSIPGRGPDHDAALAVQCTVFRIQTPDGEVFTLPVQEVRALHALTPELIERLQAAAEARRQRRERRVSTGVHEVREPFGLAAFAALPKPPSLPPYPAPEHPME